MTLGYSWLWIVGDWAGLSNLLPSTLLFLFVSLFFLVFFCIKSEKVLVLTPSNLFCSRSSALICCNCIWELKSLLLVLIRFFTLVFFIPSKQTHAENKLDHSTKIILWNFQNMDAIICKQLKFLFPYSNYNLKTACSIIGMQMYQLAKLKRCLMDRAEWFLYSSGFLDNSQMIRRFVRICWRCVFKFWNLILLCFFSSPSLIDSMLGYTLYNENPLPLSQNSSKSIPTFAKTFRAMFCFPPNGFKG